MRLNDVLEVSAAFMLRIEDIVYPKIYRGISILNTCSKIKVKSKAVPLQAWSGPEGSRKLRFAEFMTTAQEGGKVVSLTHWPPLPTENIPGTYFC